MRSSFGLLHNAKQVLHWLDDRYQQYIYERPWASYREKVAREAPWPGFREEAEQFCRDGVLVLPCHFQGEILRGMQADVNRWVEKITMDSVGRYVMNENTKAYLRDSAAFSRAAMDPWILALVRYYWGKPVFLAHSSGYRLDPSPGGRKIGPFQWHHDANRKQLKALIYLDDVSREGQRMDYLPGTHRIWHRFGRGPGGYEETRIPDEAVVPYGQPVRCAGPAGTVLLFDTNGIHRGNQNQSAKRDVWVFQYTAGRHLLPFSGLHPEVLGRLTADDRRLARAS